MNHDQTNDAVRLSLLLPDERSDSHNIYRLRPRQEDAVVAELYPSCARADVENVVPLTSPGAVDLCQQCHQPARSFVFGLCARCTGEAA